jgi:hypothetical protein
MLIKLISDYHYIAADDVVAVQVTANYELLVTTKTCGRLDFCGGTKERTLKEFNRIVAEVNAATGQPTLTKD